MTGNEIFGPFLAMMLLTAIVWVVLYYRRLSFIFANRIPVAFEIIERWRWTADFPA